MGTTHISRRTVLTTLACGIGVGSISFAGLGSVLKGDSTGWTEEWDAALLRAEIARRGKSYDPAEEMVSSFRGPEYSYQSNVRNRTIHPTRDSLEYASLLLYETDPASTGRAIGIIKRMLSLQVKDRASRYFGLWGWYMEEPPDKMHAADFNWADFNGATLLNILLEHESKLPPDVAAGCREALRDCAISIRKRNVSMDYTNIAFQGTYVTLATAELFDDSSLLAYAKDRIVRLEAAVNLSGSFAEYNSPGYMAVTIGNISRILYYVRDSQSRAIATRLNSLAWKHIAEHWHKPTMQLAGPMSRAYSNNIGYPLWIQKGTNNRAFFLTLDEISTQKSGGEASVPTVPWHCPDEFIPLFTSITRHQHREVFISGETDSGQPISGFDAPKPDGATLPVEGTTLLTPEFSLGTVDRCDCWVQRRNLIAYWGGPSRPPHCLQLRVLKDDYDFTSAIFYSAQEQGNVLGSIRFRSDGGDKHPSLDPIINSIITLNRMRLELQFQQWNSAHRILVDGKPQTNSGFTAPPSSRIAIDLGRVKVLFHARYAKFVESAQALHFTVNGTDATLSVEMMQSEKPQVVQLLKLVEPGCDFIFQMDGSDASIEKLDARFAASQYVQTSSSNLRHIAWKAGSSNLSITNSTLVQPLTKLNESFDLTVDSKPYPFVRLGNA